MGFAKLTAGPPGWVFLCPRMAAWWQQHPLTIHFQELQVEAWELAESELTTRT